MGYNYWPLLLCLYGIDVGVHLTSGVKDSKPVVIATWKYKNATLAAWDVLDRLSGNAVDAVVAGGTACEEEPCDVSVGFGGSPDESGETTLDAMIMDGSAYDVGSVADLHNIKNAIGVAHAVMKHTKHTLLVGNSATQFAVMMGFQLTNLSTSKSVQEWKEWKSDSCQPNFWQNVEPNPLKSCGPYKPTRHIPVQRQTVTNSFDEYLDPNVDVHHDTMGMLTVDKQGNIAGGTTTNGAIHKIPGRVGDSPIVGSGAYADSDVGGAAATGDGDYMMRFLPSFYAVELMRNGASPSDAATAAIQRIARVYPEAEAALIAMNMNGTYGASCRRFKWFAFTVMSSDFHDVQIVNVPCST